MGHVRTRVGCASMLSLVVIFAQAMPAQAQTKLRMKFAKGDRLTYTLDQKMVMKMNLMGKDLTMNMTMKAVMANTVNSVAEDGKANVTMKMQSMSMKMDGAPGLNVDYDSEKKKEPDDPVAKQMAAIFNALVAADFKATQSPLGTITNMQVPDEVTAALKKAAGGAPGVGDMFSKENLQKMMGQSIELPEKAVSKGDTWEQKNSVKSPFGTMETVNNFQYNGPVQKGGKNLEQILITVKTNVVPDPNGLAKITIKDQNNRGTILFDNSAGRIFESSLTQKMRMEVTVAGQNLNQDIDSTTTMKLRESQ
jgi:hypothetical protein